VVKLILLTNYAPDSGGSTIISRKLLVDLLKEKNPFFFLVTQVFTHITSNGTGGLGI
jgi:hypothetical protein